MGRTLFRVVGGSIFAVYLGGCARMSSPGFPPPARPGFLVPSDFETTFASLSMMVEARGMPVLVSDSDFGSIQTDWVNWDEGEVDLDSVARCDLPPGAPPVRTRARFSFDVRRRANRATVTIRTQWQAELRAGFAQGNRSYVDCPSTGEWERMVEQALTQRATIR